MRLADNPVRVAGQSPASNRADQGLLVRQAVVDQVWNQLGEVLDHSRHTALGYGSQSQDSGLLDLPLLVEESFFEDGQQHRKEIIPEDTCKDV